MQITKAQSDWMWSIWTAIFKSCQIFLIDFGRSSQRKNMLLNHSWTGAPSPVSRFLQSLAGICVSASSTCEWHNQVLRRALKNLTAYWGGHWAIWSRCAVPGTQLKVAGQCERYRSTSHVTRLKQKCGQPVLVCQCIIYILPYSTCEVHSVAFMYSP